MKQPLGPRQEAIVLALESNKYKQGFIALKQNENSADEPSFCVLGVICDITPGITWRDGEFYYSPQYKDKTSLIALPGPLASELRMKNGSGSFFDIPDDERLRQLHARGISSLMQLNDDYKMPLAGIAAFILENPARVFSEPI